MVHNWWRQSRQKSHSDPDQGWKLHISATIKSAAQVLARVEPILVSAGVLFKTPRDLHHLLILNSGAAGFSQIGKFITVYPRSTTEAVVLARDLHRATCGLAGPCVPFDRRYRTRSLVYYRYGSFRETPRKPSGYLRGRNGRLYRDWRAPRKAVPNWIADPFQRGAAKRRKLSRPIGLDYLVYRAISQRGKGGVYDAIDLSVSPPRRVIIKEGRRHGETDHDAGDGYSRVKHEGKVLRRLRTAGLPVPEVFREFVQKENRYLVLEPVVGRTVLSHKRLHPTRTSWRRSARLLDRLAPIVSQIHAAGWVWRDCNPSHIFVKGDALQLIDFELACRLNDKRASPWGSQNYLPVGQREKVTRESGTLEDDFALGVIAFQFMCGEFPPRSGRKRAGFYKRAECPDFLLNRIEALLRY